MVKNERKRKMNKNRNEESGMKKAGKRRSAREILPRAKIECENREEDRQTKEQRKEKNDRRRKEEREEKENGQK